ncbi:U4/U6.U5 small nuclear ribonucleoprotein 27 kDa protein [Strongyloides ratti]|uniref:U4/U6.U5 small nuclear ribonucleoprotein 27 kDa protein n=1 Tax=Strongyloides ratti TaxID=34506 RepID=A0A090MWJ4_STRRB|nr:U4/U6.U5 small nuclear ribonucleoprotein 27 kDa protein [Strongyloides ratti]CEF63804.1 U4/U6.U5 small nuclear ribonucleoprotein 27 kDa protein [Strongyloides ratti]
MGRERSPITDRRRRRSRTRSKSPVYSKRRNHYDDSPVRKHRRSRSRSRSHEDSRKGKYTPDREENSKHKNQTSKDLQKERKDSKKDQKPKQINVDKISDCEEEMMKVMGFGNFSTTKNKKVEGNDVGCVNIKKSRKYRQYMNRKGGFNKPLDFIA